MIPEYKRQLQRIRDRLDRLKTEGLDEFYQSELARLYCVELSGVLENLIKDCVIAYTRIRADKRVVEFVSNQIERFQNPDPQKILAVLKQLDSLWESELDDFWRGEIKDAIGSIVGNRHLIAHGRSTTISIARVTE